MDIIFDDGVHKNIIIFDFGQGEMVHTNIHLIVDGEEGMILDIGGYKALKDTLRKVDNFLGLEKLKWIFLSHQDPDVVAGIKKWLDISNAVAITPKVWLRFIPHFGVDDFHVNRIKGIDDEGTIIKLGSHDMYILPAHWMHSPGNFQIYDPKSRILYSGDLGASFGQGYQFVTNFEEHIRYMEAFHTRYITSGKALKNWVKMVRHLDIDIIAPQHGAIFRGKEMVKKFVEWVESLEVGLDIMDDVYNIPSKRLTFN